MYFFPAEVWKRILRNFLRTIIARIVLLKRLWILIGQGGDEISLLLNRVRDWRGGVAVRGLSANGAIAEPRKARPRVSGGTPKERFTALLQCRR